LFTLLKKEGFIFSLSSIIIDAVSGKSNQAIPLAYILSSIAPTLGLLFYEQPWGRTV